MLAFLTAIFCCQLLGELVTTATGLPVPGPVCGMAILFVGLVLRGSIPAELAAVGSGLLDNLSLLFIPAGVGVMLHARLLARDWLPLSIALVVSTCLTIAVTAMMMTWLTQSRPGPAARKDPPAGDR